MFHVNHRVHSPPAVSEAVGPRLRAGMDREARGSQVLQDQTGTCDTARHSIHVPAPQGPAPTAGQETLFCELCVR